jgi:hypothetical protein
MISVNPRAKTDRIKVAALKAQPGLVKGIVPSVLSRAGRVQEGREDEMRRGVTFRELAALMRRHLLAATAVLMIAAGLGYGLRRTPPLYSESAAVVFTVKGSLADSRPSASYLPSLIATEVMMAQALMTPPWQSEIRDAGGNASFDFTPFNSYSLQYPNYYEPGAMLTATSQRPADVRRTFTLVCQLLGQRLTAMQAGARVPARDRIQVLLVGNGAPAAQPGSPTRVLGGLFMLAAMAVFMVVNFLDRRRSGRLFRLTRGRPAP